VTVPVVTDRFLVRYVVSGIASTQECSSLDEATRRFETLRDQLAVSSVSVWVQTTLIWQAPA
jgi:hypothetical protein